MASPPPSLTATLEACLDDVWECDPAGLDDGQLAALVRDLAHVESRLKALRLQVLGAAERAGTGRRAGAVSTSAWAASLTHADPGAAHREVALAAGLEARPVLGAALGEGRISAAHAQVILDADRRLPAGVTGRQRAAVEETLVAKAQTMAPATLRRAARRALAAVEPDTRAVDAHEDAVLRDEEIRAYASTRLTLHDNGDGTVGGHFTVPVLHGHLLRKVIEAITAPRRGRLGASQAQAGPAQQTDWEHARGLGLCELIEHLPTDHLHSRAAARVVVTIDGSALRERLAAARLDTGDDLSAGEARRLACGAGLLPAVLGGASQVLDLGRQRRLFSEAQRTALGVRHRTCAADGCERPFAWCELHHRRPWSRGGRTDLDEAVPLCHFHHRRAHDGGFRHRVLPDGSLRFSRRT